MARARRLFLLLALPASAAAQQVTLQVKDTDGSGLGLTTIVIREGAGDSAATFRRLTDADGRLSWRRSAGQLTVVARHVGFRADSMTVLGDTLRGTVVMVLSRIPQQLAALVVTESADCSLPAPALSVDEMLWDEALKGIEVRGLVRSSYRYERQYRSEITQRRPLGGARTRVRDTLELNDPSRTDSVPGTVYRDGGYTARTGSTTNIRVFDEADLLKPSFLRFHCHGAPWRDSTDGSVRIAFAPRRGIPDDGSNRVRGMLVLDGVSWLLRSVSYQYVRNGKTVGTGAVAYTPMTVDRWTLTMPSRISGELSLGGFLGFSQSASWVIEQRYTGFTRVVDPQ
jgi:hypothetical protein